MEQVTQSGRGMLTEDGECFAVQERQRRLVGGGPDPVPRPVEWIGHGRTQHVVQVHLSHLQQTGTTASHKRTHIHTPARLNNGLTKSIGTQSKAQRIKH